MEGKFEFDYEEGENQECDWLKLLKINNYVTIPDLEAEEVKNNFDNHTIFSRVKQFTENNLIFYFIGSKIFFINKSNLQKFFDKV